MALVHPRSPSQGSVFGLSADPVWYTEHLAAGVEFSAVSLCYVHRRKCEFYRTTQAMLHSFLGPWDGPTDLMVGSFATIPVIISHWLQAGGDLTLPSEYESPLGHLAHLQILL